jgi:hypothetical protein
MYLICNVCHPENPAEFVVTEVTPESGAIAIAKWYPASSGISGDDGSYYSNSGATKEWADRFFDFLKLHQHKEVASEHYTAGAGQENPVRLEYESEGLPVTKK